MNSQPRKGEVGQPTTNKGHFAQTAKSAPATTNLPVEADGYTEMDVAVTDVLPRDLILDPEDNTFRTVASVDTLVDDVTVHVFNDDTADNTRPQLWHASDTVFVRRPTTPELAWDAPDGYIDEHLEASAVPDGAYVLDEDTNDYVKVNGDAFTDYGTGNTYLSLGPDERLVQFKSDATVSVRRTKTEAETLRDEAAAKEREKHDSFERSDTDGAVSQWASGISADRLRLEAQVVEQGGVHEFRALFDLEGNLVPAKNVQTRYGYAWAILSDPDDPNSDVTAWVNESKARKGAQRRKTMEKKGYREGIVKAPAKVMTGGSGTGLSGALTVSNYIGRADGGFSRDVEIVSTDDPGKDY
ncbi:hypothetical protein [Aeromicrobium sp. 179-A 4D2 NHS]|uniref:hypothetical protein n=1 Tax=Aeromicrobium sp. 179-A 4D2 NHS TaxID=3142375 RepID=UPI0039A26033